VSTRDEDVTTVARARRRLPEREKKPTPWAIEGLGRGRQAS